MQARISEGQDENKVRDEVEALLGNGWRLEGEKVLKKTYCLKSYTKVMVRDSPYYPSLPNVFRICIHVLGWQANQKTTIRQ